MENSEQTAQINARPTKKENQAWQKTRDERTGHFRLNNKGEIKRRSNRQDFNYTEEKHEWDGTDGATKRDDRHQSKIEDWDDPMSSDYDRRPPTDVDASPNEPIANIATHKRVKPFDWNKSNDEREELVVKPGPKGAIDVQDTGKFSFLDRLMRRNRAPKE